MREGSIFIEVFVGTAKYCAGEIIKKLKIVSCHQNSASGFHKTVKQRNYLKACGRIQITCWFVGQYQLGIIKQSSGYYNTLLFTST